MSTYLSIVLAPLFGAMIAGFFGRLIGRRGASLVTIAGVALSCILSMQVLAGFIWGDAAVENLSLYTWMVSDGIRFELGFLIDPLSAVMMVVVTFVSLMVHIYTMGYMQDDPGYQRFFSYISLFTFAMLMLVMANNFLQLFFGWEAVGLVSYLLIGFWYQRETAIFANLKAFLVNRVGDFGFLLGIGLIVMHFNTLDYATVFAQSARFTDAQVSLWPGVEWSLLTVICLLLFVGAMGKSAQVPLHVWLPDSMEGPTPISALIHAATMVTAGIFMVARMSPLFELSETALSVVLMIGAITAFFMGWVGIVQHDIKRVVAYSTLSQLGYMFTALGVSAYSAGIFHLMTHAFFKALLFLAAGSVIIAMHHEQDMRRMGGLRRWMPITYWTSLIGTLALVGFPGFSGFFSKDSIIEAVGHSALPGSDLAYPMILLGVFVTALYSFRLLFLVFHGEPRMDAHTREHLKESPLTVTGPLIALAIPSLLIGFFTVGPFLYSDFLGNSIAVLPEHDVLSAMSIQFTDALGFMMHGFVTPAFGMMAAGALVAWVVYLKRPDLAEQIRNLFRWPHKILEQKYGFDHLYIQGFAAWGRALGRGLWKGGDQTMIDGLMVNGSASGVVKISQWLRRIQTGYLYHYAFTMIIGVILLIGWFVLR